MSEVSAPISTRKVSKSRIRDVDFRDIPFGKIFSDHMLIADYSDGRWHSPEIMPYDTISVHPTISAIHYGQSIFEGLKAFRMADGSAAVFRPEENFRRMNRSAAGLVMPEIPHDIFIDGLSQLVKLDDQWIPDTEGSALYIRPVYFATDEYVGIKPSESYKFIIFTCPVGAYYPEPVALWVTRSYVRAFEGGTGETKAAGNYAAGLYATKLAKDKGFHNVLWLDGKEHRYVEECGTMNIFFVIGGKVITPSLSGTILRGVTRESCITLLKDAGIPVEERKIGIDEVLNAYRSGELHECFGAGTAATVAHVAKIGYEESIMNLPPVSERKIGNFLLDTLTGIRKGLIADPHNWMVKL